jgi:hypothetical protein
MDHHNFPVARRRRKHEQIKYPRDRIQSIDPTLGAPAISDLQLK